MSMIKTVKIQVLQPSGTWLTVGTVMPNEVLVQRQLMSAASVYKRKARAIDKDGGVVDIQNP